MSDKLLNKVITLSALEVKAGKFGKMAKIKDEAGKTYTVYETTSKGTTSVAWEQLQNLSVGSNVQIGYVSEIKDYQGKNYEARTIRNFNEDIGNGVQNAIDQGKDPYKGKSSNSGQSVASGSGSDDLYWDKKAYKQCLWGYFIEINRGKPLTQSQADLVWQEFTNIEKDCENRFNPSKLRQAVQRTAPKVITPEEELPTIQRDEAPPISDDDLPPF